MKWLSHPSCVVILVLAVSSLGSGCKDEPTTDDIAGSTVHVEVHPESINELITDEISITCTPKDLPQGTQNILFIEMGPEGEHPLTSLTGPTLKLGPGMKNNMETKGNIGKNLSESYLQLSIKRPFVDDVGVYCCRMFYQTEFGDLKMGHVYADVTIENNDKAVFVHLLDKVKAMEKTIKDQEQQLRDQDTKVSSRFTQLEFDGMNRSQKIQALMERGNFSSAFSVYGTKSSFNNGETLIFQNTQLNIGNHYDLATGVFTAPKAGLYVFHLFVWVHTNDDFYVHLKVNDGAVASLFLHDSKSWDQSSISTVLSLNQDDKVWPYVHVGGKIVHYDNEHHTAFNGYLLQLF